MRENDSDSLPFDSPEQETVRLKEENRRLRRLLEVHGITIPQLPPPQQAPVRVEPLENSLDREERARKRIALFRSLFRGREDVYARRWERGENSASGPTIAMWSSTPFPFVVSHSRKPTKAPRPGKWAASSDPGDADGVLRDGVRVVGDHNPAALLDDPLQVRDDTLHVKSIAVGSDRFADSSAPVVHTRQTKGEESRATRCTVVGEPP